MDELRDAKQRVALAESVMKLPYIKATRNASTGQERFVARDDVITAIHEYAKQCRDVQPVPAEGAQADPWFKRYASCDWCGKVTHDERQFNRGCDNGGGFMREACRGTFRVSPILDKPTSPPATAAPAEREVK